MNQKLAIVLFAFAFVVAVVVGFGNHADVRPEPAEFRAKFQETLLKPRKKPDAVVVPGPKDRQPSSESGDRRPAGAAAPLEEREPLSREAFAAKYGETLEMTEYEGRLIRIDGSAIPTEKFDPSQKVPGFRTLDSAQVAARAREIFEDARHLLGLPDDATVIMHPPTLGESTSQVVFQQSDAFGVPVSPGGLVTVLVGPDGEARAVDSSVYPKTEVANVATLPLPKSGREILFVTQSAPVAVLHHAYETRERGIQKVVDAQTGAVLLEKDRRIQ